MITIQNIARRHHFLREVLGHIDHFMPDLAGDTDVLRQSLERNYEAVRQYEGDDVLINPYLDRFLDFYRRDAEKVIAAGQTYFLLHEAGIAA